MPSTRYRLEDASLWSQHLLLYTVEPGVILHKKESKLTSEVLLKTLSPRVLAVRMSGGLAQHELFSVTNRICFSLLVNQVAGKPRSFLVKPILGNLESPIELIGSRKIRMPPGFKHRQISPKTNETLGI